MPLSCDCYAGCWGAHSENWPKLGKTDAEAASLYRLAHVVLPYGTYVFMETHLRVETYELAERLSIRYCQQEAEREQAGAQA